MENELYHWGIKGMRWGIRRYQNKDGSLTDLGKKRLKTEDYHEDYNKAHSSKNVKLMSDKELRERINRLQMENQYLQLTKRNVSFVKRILTDASKQILSKYVSRYMTKGADTFIEKYINRNIGD